MGTTQDCERWGGARDGDANARQADFARSPLRKTLRGGHQSSIMSLNEGCKPGPRVIRWHRFHGSGIDRTVHGVVAECLGKALPAESQRGWFEPRLACCARSLSAPPRRLGGRGRDPAQICNFWVLVASTAAEVHPSPLFRARPDRRHLEIRRLRRAGRSWGSCQCSSQAWLDSGHRSDGKRTYLLPPRPSSCRSSHPSVTVAR